MLLTSDRSKKGATFLASTNDPLRALVVDLVRNNPKADREDLFDEFMEAVDGNEEYRLAIHMYYFRNMFTYAQSQYRPEPSMGSDMPPAKSGIAVSMAAKIERQAKIQEAVKKNVNQIQLLLQTMPNGKPMRYCTGIEMQGFGGAYVKIGKRAGTKMIGQVFNEEGVRAVVGL